MRVCDRHPRTPATDEITLRSTDEHFDMCEKCAEMVSQFMKSPKQEEIDKPAPKWRQKIPA